MSKYKEFFKDLFQSIYKTKNLFKFAIYNWITPFVIFVLVGVLFALPVVVSYNSLSIEHITNNVSYVDQAMAFALSTDIKCSVNEDKLSCEEGYSYESIPPHQIINANNDVIKYKIYVNSDISSVDFSVGNFGQHHDTDNYLVLFENSFVYRFTYHNPKDQTVTEYQGLGFYDNLNGTDFHSIYEESLTQEDPDAYLLEKSKFIILEGYKVLAYETSFANVALNIIIYILFVLVTALLLKGNFLLKRKKGFKYTQAIKIAFVASLQSALIGFVISLFGIEFMNAFGISLVIRVLYIYIKYTGSRKNTQWLDDLYDLTKDERFKI